MTCSPPSSSTGRSSGQTTADEPDKVLGRTIETTLGDLNNDASENNIKLTFKINEVASDSAYTEFVKHEATRDYLRSLVRRGSSKIEAFITVLTTDDYRVQIQPVALTTKSADESQEQAIRRTMIDPSASRLRTGPSSSFVDSIVEGRLSSAIYGEAKDIYPAPPGRDPEDHPRGPPRGSRRRRGDLRRRRRGGRRRGRRGRRSRRVSRFRRTVSYFRRQRVATRSPSLSGGFPVR